MGRVFLTLFVLTSLVACDHLFTESITKDEANAAYTKNVIDEMASWKTCCIMNTILAEDLVNFRERRIVLPYLPDLLEANSKADWRNVDKQLQKQFKEIITEKEPTEKEKLATMSIQYSSLIFIQRFLLSRAPTNESAEAMERYLRILVRHKAVDLSVMTDGLLLVRKEMSSESYEEIKRYILTTANERRIKAITDVEKIMIAIRETEDPEKINSLYSDAKSLENQTLEASYVIDELAK